nr:superinfection immunity protein [Polynucleobacter necessarius]
MLSLFYFLPFAIAFRRANSGAIFALNLFLGWSLIGWVVALVWAMKDVSRSFNQTMFDHYRQNRTLKIL